MPQSAGTLRIEYLAFSTIIATLPIYEPALHSFYTLNAATFGASAAALSISALVTCLVTGVALILNQHFRAVMLDTSKPLSVSLCGCLYALGTIGPCLATAFGLPLIPAIVLGSCGGIGSAAILIIWGKALSHCDKRSTLAYLALDSVLGALLMNMIGTLPLVLATSLLAVLIILGITAVCLIPDSAGPEAPKLRLKEIAKDAAIPLMGLGLFGTSFQVLGNHSVLYFYLSSLVGTIFAGLAVLTVLLLLSGKPIVALLYDAVLPAVGLAVLAITVACPEGIRSSVLADGLIVFFSFAAPLLVASVVSRAGSGECDPARLIAFAIVAFCLSALLGRIATTIFPPDIPSLSFCVLAVAYVACQLLIPAFQGSFAHIRQPHDEKPPEESNVTTPVPLDLTAICTAHNLTEREAEVLPMLLEGRAASYVARELYISDSTARGHAHRIYQKFGVTGKEALLEVLSCNTSTSDSDK